MTWTLLLKVINWHEFCRFKGLKMLHLKYKTVAGAYGVLAFIVFGLGCLIVNFIQLCFLLASPVIWSGDLATIGRAVVKLVGIFPPASLVTVWF